MRNCNLCISNNYIFTLINELNLIWKGHTQELFIIVTHFTEKCFISSQMCSAEQ